MLGIALGSCSGGTKQASDAAPRRPGVRGNGASRPGNCSPAAAAARRRRCTGDSPPRPSVGTPFSVKMGNGDVAKITIVSAVRTNATTTAFATAAKNGTYLLLDVLWETEAGKTSSNPFYFSAKDSNGRKADLNLFADNQLALHLTPTESWFSANRFRSALRGLVSLAEK